MAKLINASNRRYNWGAYLYQRHPMRIHRHYDLYFSRGTIENFKKHDEKFVQMGLESLARGLMTCS